MTDPAAERYARIGDLMAEARGLEGAELEAFLSGACGDDTELCDEVRELLALSGQDTADAFSDNEMARSRKALESLVDEIVPAKLPDRIGQYSVERQIGAGGMGVVYEAVQDSPRRRVAIKVMRELFDDLQSVKRFELESRVLARMKHPGIAHIYEVSTFDAGHGPQPYFAMELVSGVGLTEYARDLDVRDRVRLFVGICDAVDHAHEAGVIHRDLKPGNVLVDAEGRTKILDFGIARSTAAERTVLTRQTGTILGTIDYMSPEQVCGDQAATATTSDVYSLGVMLYELLSGQLPLALGEQPLTQITKTIVHTEPKPLGALRRELRGDLETIAHKAMAKEPARRYASAAELRADLQRYLADQPIHARPPGMLYELRKFASRNRALVGAAAIVTIALVVGSLTAISYWLDATRRLDDATKAEAARQQELVNSIASVAPAGLPVVIDSLDGSATALIARLRARFADTDRPAEHRLRLACVLAAFGELEGDYLVEAIPDAAPGECDNLIRACERLPARCLEDLARHAASGALADRIRYSIVLLGLGKPDAIRKLLAFLANPEARVETIHAFKTWHGGLHRLPALVASARDPALQSGLVAAIGGIPADTFPPDLRRELEGVFLELFRTSPSAPVHSTTRWALGRFGVPLPEIPRTSGPAPGYEWFRTTSGITLVRLPAGIFQMTPMGPCVQFSRELWVRDRETPHPEVADYFVDPEYAATRPETLVVAGVDHGAAVVSWTDAALYCNWLSEREGLDPCYSTAGDEGGFRLDRDASGYRLPTSAELEFALRGGTTTTWISGDRHHRLSDYANIIHDEDRASDYLPNGFGLFEVAGTQFEHATDHTTGGFGDGAEDPIGATTGNYRDGRGGSSGAGTFWSRSGQRRVASIHEVSNQAIRPVRHIGPPRRRVDFGVDVGTPPRVRADGAADGTVEVRIRSPLSEAVDCRLRFVARGGFVADPRIHEIQIPASGVATVRFRVSRPAGDFAAAWAARPGVVLAPRLSAEQLVRIRPRLSSTLLSALLPPPTAASHRVLTLDGKSAVRVDFGSALHDLSQFTLEAWVRCRAAQETERIALVTNTQASGFGLFLAERGALGDPPAGCVHVDGAYRVARLPGLVKFPNWTHVALCYDGETLTSFIDGAIGSRVAAKGRITPSAYPLFVGADPGVSGPMSFFTGEIDEVRLSRVVRYREAFQPAHRHVPDADTLLLLHFDATANGIHGDASGRGNHGFSVGQPRLSRGRQ